MPEKGKLLMVNMSVATAHPSQAYMRRLPRLCSHVPECSLRC